MRLFRISGALLCAIVVPYLAGADEVGRAADLTAMRLWADTHLLKDNGVSAAFSFQYGGAPSKEMLPTWDTKQTEEGGHVSRTFTDPKTGLKVDCKITRFDAFPAVEWVVRLTNTGNAETPLIENLLALDASLEGLSGEVVVHHSLGDSNSDKSFAPVEEVFAAERREPLVFSPSAGRSSEDHLPLRWRWAGPDNGARPFSAMRTAHSACGLASRTRISCCIPASPCARRACCLCSGKGTTAFWVITCCAGFCLHTMCRAATAPSCFRRFAPASR